MKTYMYSEIVLFFDVPQISFNVISAALHTPPHMYDEVHTEKISEKQF